MYWCVEQWHLAFHWRLSFIAKIVKKFWSQAFEFCISQDKSRRALTCRKAEKYIRIYKLIKCDIFVSMLASVKCLSLTENTFTFNPQICCFCTRFSVCLRHLYRSGACCQNYMWFIRSGRLILCDKCCYGFCITKLLWTSEHFVSEYAFTNV